MEHFITFNERYDTKKAHYLKNMTLEQFVTFRNKPEKSKKDNTDKYKLLRNICNVIIHNNGQFDMNYAYSRDTHPELGGRYYSCNGIQGVSKFIRGFLASHTTDIDMKNAHPTILKWICKKHNIDCPQLSYYVENRETILMKHDNPDVIKTAYLKMVNTNKPLPRCFKDEQMRAFDKEMGKIQKRILEIEEYKPIRDLIPNDKKLQNEEGSMINRVLCMYENRILNVARDAIIQCEDTHTDKHLNLEIFALMFDGCMIYGDHYNNTDLLDYITISVNDEFEGLDMKWAYKPHSTIIQMPDDYQLPEIIVATPIISTENAVVSQFNNETRTFDESYEFMKEKF